MFEVAKTVVGLTYAFVFENQNFKKFRETFSKKHLTDCSRFLCLCLFLKARMFKNRVPKCIHFL